MRDATIHTDAEDLEQGRITDSDPRPNWSRKQCRSCGAPLTLLKRMSGDAYCSPAHEQFDRQRKVRKLAKLLDDAQLYKSPVHKVKPKELLQPVNTSPRLRSCGLDAGLSFVRTVAASALPAHSRTVLETSPPNLQVLRVVSTECPATEILAEHACWPHRPLHMIELRTASAIVLAGAAFHGPSDGAGA